MIDNLDQGMQMHSTTIQVSQEIKNSFLVAVKWAKFLAIIGFVSVGLLVIAGLAMLFGSASINSGGQLAGVGIGYIILSGIYIFPAIKLFRFATETKKGIENENQGDFEFGIENLKSLFKFIGIFTIVILSFYVLLFLIGFIGLAAM
jgi:Family of unknown function (DUF5362)